MPKRPLSYLLPCYYYNMSIKVYWNTFRAKYKHHPKPAFPSGSRVYIGYQGQGKTLSMAQYAFFIHEKCPKAKIFSNIVFNNLEYEYFCDSKGLEKALSYSNGLDGVLVIIDEAHLFFNRKDGISLDVLTAISQQRKDLRRIVFSSQIWEELDISLRKQVKEIVRCKAFLHFQINRITNGETLSYDKLKGEYVAEPIGWEIFKHNERLYNCYDTRQKIVNNNNYEQLGGRGTATPLAVALPPDKRK